MFTHAEDGACIHFKKNILSVCQVLIDEQPRSRCACVVCSYFTHKGMLTFSTLCWCWWNSLLLKLSTSCCRPFLWLSLLFPLCCTNVFISYLYLISSKNQHSFDLGFISMFVLLNQTAMHASSVYCMERLKYLFYLKDTFVWGIKGSFKLVRVCVFASHWENVCACQTWNCTFLKLFRWRP